ncbi:DUF2789 family protein [Nocardia sp. NPDC057668]|uniref:DUF2789 family protein n=1 Tax=Nocardia sp. NPDC057668 TaxID=3346202 RepID=UPI00366E77EA
MDSEDDEQYTLQELFEMLGLPSAPADIDSFVTRHSITKRGVHLFDAHFWTRHQREYFWDLHEDGHCEQAFNELDELLRRT